MIPSRPASLDVWLPRLAVGLLAMAFITGGGSMDRGWGDVATQLLALPVIVLAVMRLLQPPVARSRWIVLAIAALGPATVAAQWLLGTTASPWATERALYAWLPPVAAFLAALAVPFPSRRLGLQWLAGLACASLVLACLQLAAPQDSLLNPFPDLKPMFTGLFANPNHQGTALAIGAVLLLSGATASPREEQGRWVAMRYVRIALGALLLLALPFTGSRAMVLIGAAAVIALPLVGGWLGRKWRHRHGRRQVLVLGGAGLAGLVLVLWIAMGWMRVDRMEQGRSVMAAATTALAVEAMPAGIGAGAFVPWFDAHIPEPMLQYNYINHAHNEYLQWWLEGGVAGLAWSLLLLAGFIWACPRPDARGHRPDAAWVGSWLGVACLLAHSVVDYPMRTPALATAGAWMAAVAIASRLRQRQRRKTEQARPDPSPSVPVSPRP